MYNMGGLVGKNGLLYNEGLWNNPEMSEYHKDLVKTELAKMQYLNKINWFECLAI